MKNNIQVAAIILITLLNNGCVVAGVATAIGCEIVTLGTMTEECTQLGEVIEADEG